MDGALGVVRGPPAAQVLRPVDVHPDIAVLDLDFEAGNRPTVGVLRPESGAHVELPAVGGAGHDCAAEIAFGERVASMGAGILHGVHSAVDPEQPHRQASDGDAQTAGGRYVRQRGYALDCHSLEL